jgi:hypothetical protein
MFKLAEALESNTALTSLYLGSNTCCFISFSLEIDNGISNEGAIRLSEALKSNTSLASLDLQGIRLDASFHSHTIQLMILKRKQLSDYLKH